MNSVESNSLLSLTDMFAELLEEQTSNETHYKDNKDFAEQMMIATNAVFGEYNGWREISNVSTKYEKVSSYLNQLDKAAFLWAEQKKNTSDANKCRSDDSKIFSNMEVIIKQVELNTSKSSSKECVQFGTQNLICVESSSLKVK